MNNDILILSLTAASMGFFHTLLGPDHYLPFIVMSKARNWSTFKTVSITVLCGLGHVGSSVLLGAVGVIFGIGLSKLEFIESMRGDWAAWAFLIFGLGYLIWAIWRIRTNKPHSHLHIHGTTIHVHEHDHEHNVGETPHSHTHKEKTTNLTPWILFLVFVLGPCEPLIPILMYPAAQSSVVGLITVTSVFAITTVCTMLAVVLAINYGVNFVKIGKLEKYTHVFAGGTVALSGVLILLGL